MTAPPAGPEPAGPEDARLLAYAGWAVTVWRSVLLGDVDAQDARRRCEDAAAELPAVLTGPARIVAETVRLGLWAVAEGELSPHDFEAMVLMNLRGARS